MESAMNKVFDAPELLEMILVHVDMRSLLTSAQRVCHQWTNLINQSPTIQKALFFTPIRNTEWGVEEKILNPLLMEAFPSIFPAQNRPKGFQFDFGDLAITKDASTMAIFARKDASWRRMLVQQPPAGDIGLFHVVHAQVGDGVGTSSLPPDRKLQESGYDGIRMERLFDLLLFSHRVEFVFHTRARVYWSSEEPIAFEETSKRSIRVFHEMMSRFDVVLYTREVIQCCSVDRLPSAEEMTRREIMTAYTRHGLDVRGKSQDIKDSEVEEDYSMQRR